MCTRQRTASLKSFSLGNMQDKACLVLDLRELRPRHQVTAQGVPGQDAKQLVRLVAGKSQPASGPKPQRTRRRGWWWRRRSHRQISRQKTTSLCLKVSKELWQGGRPVQQKTDAGGTSLFLSPVRVDLQLVFPLRQLSMLVVHAQRHKRSISDRSINIKVNVHWEDRIPASNNIKQIKYCELAEESRTADWVATISLRWDAGALPRSWRCICWGHVGW